MRAASNVATSSLLVLYHSQEPIFNPAGDEFPLRWSGQQFPRPLPTMTIIKIQMPRLFINIQRHIKFVQTHLTNAQNVISHVVFTFALWPSP